MNLLRNAIAMLFAVVTIVIAAKFEPYEEGKFSRIHLPRQSEFRTPRATLDQIYGSTDTPLSIPDVDTVESLIFIADDIEITDLNVRVSITHPWMRDLRISLVAPSDTDEVVLLDLFPGDNVQNMTDCWFDDEADSSILTGFPPFTGSFRPLDALEDFDGFSSSGTWKLRVIDRFALDTGTLESWAIEVNRPVQLSGIVRSAVDSSTVAEATVILSGLDTLFTGSTGRYEFDQVPDGVYDLIVSHPEFLLQTVTGLGINQESRLVVDLYLDSRYLIVQYESNARAVDIPDNDVTGDSMRIPVDLEDLPSDLDVTVNITHTYIGDIRLFLSGPTGGRIYFNQQFCAFHDSNLYDVTFDDEAEEVFPDGENDGWLGPELTGQSFRPVQHLSVFDSIPAAGDWYLVAQDNCELDVGTIDGFTLTFKIDRQQQSVPRPMPQSFEFLPAYPNPFNSRTELRFILPRDAQVDLSIYNTMGQHVREVLRESVVAGSHSISFDASDLAAGLYFARLSTPLHSQTQKIILLK